MAESKNNVLTFGLSGKIGDQIVFRQKDGKTIVATKPKESGMPATEAQKQVRGRFQQAVVYGRAVLADATTKAAYSAAATAGQSAYNVAVADFFNAPEIDKIDLTKYSGNKGDTITVRVTDDFKVQSVGVRIENQDTTLVEEGAAVLGVNGLDWVYTATKTNPSLTGDKITITAKDTPDNTSTKETVLS